MQRDMQSFYFSFGQLLRHHRKRCGLNQSALANAVGLSRTSITNIERGRQRLPLHLFAEIVRLLEVDPRDLLPKPTEEEAAIKPQYRKVLANRTPHEIDAVRRIDRRLESESQR